MKSQTTSRQRWVRSALTLAFIGLSGLYGCDIIDPTQVTNPRTTEEDLANARNPTQALLPGLRAQFARALGATVVTTDIVSDNYSIQSTGLSLELDDPYIIIPDVGTLNSIGGTGAYWNLQELRALADFTLSTAAGDETATSGLIAEVHYYRGMAFLMQGENFVALPIEADGSPIEGRALVERAVADLNQVLTIAPDGALAVPAKAALARAHRVLGNTGEAERFANEVLATNPSFVFSQAYSAAEIDNLPWLFLVSRTSKEMQPLPRLDFLDPKYPTRESAIPAAKAEEMHLILAEVKVSRGDYGAAAGHIADAAALARSRPMATFTDNDERKNANLTVRPRHATFLVRANAESPFRAGLVQNRPGMLLTPTISNTSLNPDSVRALPAAQQEDIRHALYLARQEILFLEGRRMSDLGIRLPMSRREIDTNPNLNDQSVGARPFIPDFIPQGGRMDLFEPASPYQDPSTGTNPSTNQITILADMNRRIAQNYGVVSPFGSQ